MTPPPLRPRSRAWRSLGQLAFRNRDNPADPAIPGGLVFDRRGLRVISSIDTVQLPGRPEGETGLTWVVSATYKGRRASDKQLDLVRKAFGLEAGEEDNHHPGIARTLFLPVDEEARGLCECKETEDVIVEPDGYTWTNPTTASGERCRGCELEDLMASQGVPRPCPIHHGVTR